MNIVLLLIFVLLLANIILTLRNRRKKYQDPLLKRIKYDVSKLDPKIEKLEFYSSDESFTEDKQKVFLCLKDKNGKYYSYNMLIYVAIHECSHALTDVIDVEHITPEFRNMFENLLRKATEIGVYNPISPLEEHYCGIDLDTKDMQR